MKNDKNDPTWQSDEEAAYWNAVDDEADRELAEAAVRCPVCGLIDCEDE